MPLPEVISSEQQIHDHLFPDPRYQKVWITCLEDINRRKEPTSLYVLIDIALDIIAIIYELSWIEQLDLLGETAVRVQELTAWCDNRMVITT